MLKMVYTFSLFLILLDDGSILRVVQHATTIDLTETGPHTAPVKTSTTSSTSVDPVRTASTSPTSQGYNSPMSSDSGGKSSSDHDVSESSEYIP